MKISVTQEDIRNGVPQDAASCPIALACKRAKVCGDAEVFVRNTHIDCTDGRTFSLPYEARRFINRFDSDPEFSDMTVQPFEFEVG